MAIASLAAWSCRSTALLCPEKIFDKAVLERPIALAAALSARPCLCQTERARSQTARLLRPLVL